MSKPKKRFHWFRIILGAVILCLIITNVTIFSVSSYFNTNEYLAKVLPPRPVDETPPTIKLKGDEIMEIGLGSTYNEPGAEYYDDITESTLDISGKVSTDEIGEYKITYTAYDEHGNTSNKTRTVKVIQSRGRIYLTFDDGPGEYTAELLDILAKYNVKATFFVTGNGSDDLIAREYNEGHTVALHTFTHNYSYVYSSVDNYFADLYRIQERVKNITGYTSMLIRFPGGSSNTVSTRYDGGSRIMSTLSQEVTNRGFTYFDWNITSGDAGGTTTSDGIYRNVIYNLKEGGDSIVLQHDIKGFSVDAVERIIIYGKEHGYTFCKLDASSFTAHHGINN